MAFTVDGAQLETEAWSGMGRSRVDDAESLLRWTRTASRCPWTGLDDVHAALSGSTMADQVQRLEVENAAMRFLTSLAVGGDDEPGILLPQERELGHTLDLDTLRAVVALLPSDARTSIRMRALHRLGHASSVLRSL